ncbi:hypothetical protein JCM11251_000144 [Rhodosporidiobolus azoricus]
MGSSTSKTAAATALPGATSTPSTLPPRSSPPPTDSSQVSTQQPEPSGQRVTQDAHHSLHSPHMPRRVLSPPLPFTMSPSAEPGGRELRPPSPFGRREDWGQAHHYAQGPRQGAGSSVVLAPSPSQDHLPPLTAHQRDWPSYQAPQAFPFSRVYNSAAFGGASAAYGGAEYHAPQGTDELPVPPLAFQLEYGHVPSAAAHTTRAYYARDESPFAPGSDTSSTRGCGIGSGGSRLPSELAGKDSPATWGGPSLSYTEYVERQDRANVRRVRRASDGGFEQIDAYGQLTPMEELDYTGPPPLKKHRVVPPPPSSLEHDQQVMPLAPTLAQPVPDRAPTAKVAETLEDVFDSEDDAYLRAPGAAVTSANLAAVTASVEFNAYRRYAATQRASELASADGPDSTFRWTPSKLGRGTVLASNLVDASGDRPYVTWDKSTAKWVVTKAWRDTTEIGYKIVGSTMYVGVPMNQQPKEAVDVACELLEMSAPILRLCKSHTKARRVLQGHIKALWKRKTFKAEDFDMNDFSWVSGAASHLVFEPPHPVSNTDVRSFDLALSRTGPSSGEPSSSGVSISPLRASVSTNGFAPSARGNVESEDNAYRVDIA